MIKSYILDEKIFSSSKEAFMLNDKSFFGEKRNGKIEYTPIESKFLLDSGKMQLYSDKEKLSELKIHKRLKKIDKKIEIKTLVFADLRKKGYIVKSALKFGAEFRVYEKGKNPEQEHAKWIVFPIKENESIKWQEFSAKNRVAHSTKKKLLLALIDVEDNITYYEIAWIRP